MKVYVIPDVGAHLSAFKDMLRYAGVESNNIPEDNLIIQLGDLVHKGEQSLDCLILAEGLLHQNPGRYIQLIGNHEAHYLGGPSLKGRNGVSPIGGDALRILQRLWDEGRILAAYGLETNLGPILFTHGGLTSKVWKEVGSPLSVLKAAETLNLLRYKNPELLFREGSLTLGGDPRLDAGILTPRTGAELIASWAELGEMPFSQIHGHETLYWWVDEVWHSDVPEEIRLCAEIDKENFRTRVNVGENFIWSIDPGFGKESPILVPSPVELTTKQKSS
jgi:hypothetical protein